ncbi:hypothetical protein BDQ17DRAFT_1431802 [Cyathus striatus]|nr:hypothetical protein BDQ17DRAFT_1431802 [Cyathus striatus]
MRIGEDFEELSAPSDLVMQHGRMFSTLQRLAIGPQVNDTDVLGLTQWIALNASQSPLMLTHFKLSARISLDDVFLFQLLNALASAPLQVLVLDGINEGSFELIDVIATSCPQLLGLTLNRRENILQRKCNFATWPHSSWEYAPHFSGFQRLEHFTWNFRVNKREITPASLLYFEEGFLSEDKFGSYL